MVLVGVMTGRSPGSPNDVADVVILSRKCVVRQYSGTRQVGWESDANRRMVGSCFCWGGVVLRPSGAGCRLYCGGIFIEHESAALLGGDSSKCFSFRAKQKMWSASHLLLLRGVGSIFTGNRVACSSPCCW